jgi:hypothetical protein
LIASVAGMYLQLILTFSGSAAFRAFLFFYNIDCAIRVGFIAERFQPCNSLLPMRLLSDAPQMIASYLSPFCTNSITRLLSSLAHLSCCSTTGILVCYYIRPGCTDNDCGWMTRWAIGTK